MLLNNLKSFLILSRTGVGNICRNVFKGVGQWWKNNKTVIGWVYLYEPLIKDSTFNMETHTIWKGAKKFFNGWLKMVIKRMSTGKDLESRCPWLSVNEGNLRLRVISLLEWVHCVKTNPPEGMDLIHLIKWKMVRGSPEHWQSLLLSLSL